jgi:heme exporter protein B
MSFVSDVVALAGKDLRIELRSLEAVASAAALAAGSLLLFGLAAGPDQARLRSFAPGLTWIALLYAAIATSDRLERVDRSSDAFSGLWLLVNDRRAIYVAKVAALSLILVVLEIGLWALAAFVLDLPLGPGLLGLVPIAIMTAVSIASVAVIVGALAATSPGRSLLLLVLLTPLLAPTFVGAVAASGAVLEDRAVEATGWIALVAVQAVLFTGLGLLTYETAASPE